MRRLRIAPTIDAGGPAGPVRPGLCRGRIPALPGLLVVVSLKVVPMALQQSPIKLAVLPLNRQHRFPFGIEFG